MSEEDQKTPSTIDLSRRHFLRDTATLTAGLSLAGMVTLANMPPAQAAQLVPDSTQPADRAKALPDIAKPADRAKALLVDRARCTGCHSCVFACSMQHDNVVRPSTARIHVRRYYGLVDVPIICWHCQDAPCVAACPVTPQKAIVKNKDTNVVTFVDERLCLGASCNKCLEACPPQYLRRHPETAKPLFCDLCGGNPQCVKACARQSMETGEILRSDGQFAGVHWSYREMTPAQAAEGLMLKLFYPNQTGERR